MYLYSLAVDEVSQGHLLVAGEVVPRRCVGEDVHRKVAVDEVSDELTADVLIHEFGVLKFERFQECLSISTLFTTFRESRYTRPLRG